MARVLPSIACVVCAVAALWLAFMTYNQVALAGFPDGHVTDYDKAADGPLGVFSYVEAGFGLLFLVLAFPPIKARRRAVGLLVCLIALLLAPSSCRSASRGISGPMSVSITELAASPRPESSPG
jgi:hypothetical protein